METKKMAKEVSHITDDEFKKVKEIIERSGNSFHCKVLNILKKNKWNTLVSPYYTDIFSAKPREIDIIAEKHFLYKSSFGNEKTDIVLRLFMECKFVPQNVNVVFWFHSKNTTKIDELIKNRMYCPLDNKFTDQLHYRTISEDHPVLDVAKLFADEKAKGIENEIFFKALSQTLNAMIYYRERSYFTVISPVPKKLIVLDYPVIICNSFENFYQVYMDKENDIKKIQDNFLLEVNYAYDKKEEFFLIDIVEFNAIENFFESLNIDANTVGQLNTVE